MTRHIHADMMIEAAEDTSIEWQCRPSTNRSAWVDARTPNWGVDIEYRKKPREFQEGHWYPCVYGGDSMVCAFDGRKFMKLVTNDFGIRFGQTEFSWIGESLGKIEFPS